MSDSLSLLSIRCTRTADSSFNVFICILLFVIFVRTGGDFNVIWISGFWFTTNSSFHFRAILGKILSTFVASLFIWIARPLLATLYPFYSNASHV